MRFFHTLFFWIAVTLYGGAFVVDLSGRLWDRPGWVKTARWLAVLAVTFHGAQILILWRIVGHGPFITLFEILSSEVWVMAALYLAAQWHYPFLKRLAPFCYGAAFLLLGLAGVATTPGNQQPPLTFQSWWLVLHVLFAKVTFGSLLISVFSAVLHFAQPGGTLWRHWLKDVEPDEIDRSVYRFASLSFAACTVMILTGAIWAQHAWGSYWNWDSVETWSLVTWLFLGLELHLIKTLHWRGRKLAWVSLGTFLLAVFSLFFVVFIFPSLHEGYLVIF